MDEMKIGMPKFCDITISTKCPLRCKMCNAWECGKDAYELSFDEVRTFVDSVAEFVTTPLEINVMGGEPLLVPWCLDACSYIAEKGFDSIISTNAYLIDEDMAKRIADSRLTVLAISLESLTPEIHDYYRGVKGVHARVMKALEYLDKHCKGKLAITVLTIIMKRNLHELAPLAEWVKKQGLFQNISYLALLETGLVSQRHQWHLQPTYDELWPRDKRERNIVLTELMHLKQSGFPIWNPLSQLTAFKEYYTDPDLFMKTTPYALHDYILDLDERKEVYISGERLGSMKTDTIKKLWYSDLAQTLREQIRTKGPGKRSCVINFVCAFPEDPRPQEDVPHCGSLEVVRTIPDERKAAIRTPRFCVIELTHECPMRCVMCYNWKKPPSASPVSIEEVKKFVSQLGRFVARPFEINLAGGEPLLMKDVVSLIHHIRAQDMTVSLTTAGYLASEVLVRDLSTSGLTYLPFSLDSLDPEVHDYVRGRPGTHARIMKAISTLQQNRGTLRSLTIQTIIMKPTLSGLLSLIEWAHVGNIAVSLMAFMRPNGLAIDPAWFKKDEYSWLWPSDFEEVERIIDQVIHLKQKGYIIDNSFEQLEAFKRYYRDPLCFIKGGSCSLGDGIINVNPDGDIFICWEQGALGNIRIHSIESLWYSPQTDSMRKLIRSCTRNCSEMVNCYFEPGEHRLL